MFPRVKITADDNVALTLSVNGETFNDQQPKCNQTVIGMSKCAIIMSLLILGCLIFGGMVLVISTSPEPPQSTKTQQPEASYKLHRVIERSEWGGSPPPPTTQTLFHPTHLVIISHTATGFCKTTKDCIKKVLSIHSYHSSRRSNDIGYNFLIGGDGSVYVGRGWDAVNFHRNNSIAVCFIGNYLFDELTTEMINAAEALLDAGVQLGKLEEDYRIVGHNQVVATQSPGPNVRKIIKTWPHYSAEKLF